MTRIPCKNCGRPAECYDGLCCECLDHEGSWATAKPATRPSVKYLGPHGEKIRVMINPDKAPPTVTFYIDGAPFTAVRVLGTS